MHIAPDKIIKGVAIECAKKRFHRLVQNRFQPARGRDETFASAALETLDYSEISLCITHDITEIDVSSFSRKAKSARASAQRFDETLFAK